MAIYEKDENGLITSIKINRKVNENVVVFCKNENETWEIICNVGPHDIAKLIFCMEKLKHDLVVRE